MKKKKSMSPLTLVLILSASFFAIFMIISGALFLYRAPSGGAPGPGKGALFGGGSVGVIELNGVIMDSKKILTKLEKFERDSDVAAVVVRLNSPGGAVAPSQEIYEAVKKYKKPLVVSMGSIAASGAFYVACGAKKVFANPGTITGSIGVIMEFANLEKLYEWAKIRRYVIKTGKFKDIGAEYKEMDPDERALLQGMINDVLSQFKRAVADGRKLPLEQVTAVADGRIMSGAQAKQAKLVDELGTLDDAVQEAGKMAGLKGKPRVVYPERSRPRIMDFILDDYRGDDSSESSSPIRKLLGSVVGSVPQLEPGMYWLWTGTR